MTINTTDGTADIILPLTNVPEIPLSYILRNVYQEYCFTSQGSRKIRIEKAEIPPGEVPVDIQTSYQVTSSLTPLPGGSMRSSILVPAHVNHLLIRVEGLGQSMDNSTGKVAEHHIAILKLYLRITKVTSVHYFIIKIIQNIYLLNQVLPFCPPQNYSQLC